LTRRSPTTKISPLDRHTNCQDPKWINRSGDANPQVLFVDSESDAHEVDRGRRDLITTRNRRLHPVFFRNGYIPDLCIGWCTQPFIKRVIFKCYKSWVNEGRYKNQPSKNKKHAKQSKHLLIS
jgi:hypothetical protein